MYPFTEQGVPSSWTWRHPIRCWLGLSGVLGSLDFLWWTPLLGHRSSKTLGITSSIGKSKLVWNKKNHFPAYKVGSKLFLLQWRTYTSLCSVARCVRFLGLRKTRNHLIRVAWQVRERHVFLHNTCICFKSPLTFIACSFPRLQLTCLLTTQSARHLPTLPLVLYSE